MPYFVITTNEDGDVYFRQMEKDELVEGLSPDKDGVAEIPAKEVRTEVKGFTALRDGPGIYIIKGKLVAPKPKKVITAFEVD